MSEFGLRASGLRAPARFTMTGVSADPEKPHVLIVRHVGLSNPVRMDDAISGRISQRPEDIDAMIEIISRAGVTGWEGVLGEATPERVARYLREVRQLGEVSCDAAIAALPFDLYCYVANPKNFGVTEQDPIELGKE